MPNPESLSEPGCPAETLVSAFGRLRAAYSAEPFPSLDVRQARLVLLEAAVRSSADAFAEAIRLDFGHRSSRETMLGEIWITLNHLRYIRSHLKRWMKPRRQRVHFAFQPGRARVVPQPLGVVGIISPWNYPVMLALVPLAGALSAGNRVILKPSEHTPRTSALIARLLHDLFGRDPVCVVEGDVAAGRAVASLPLDHLLFTGSEAVGRAVAKVAAENLVPLTLELGGKCPAVWHPSFSLTRFAASVAQGKCFNAGQSCVAPDYLMIPRGTEAAVIDAIAREVSTRYPTMAVNPDYSSVAGPRQLSRLGELLDDAVARGARRVEVNPGGETFDGTGKLPFTMILDIPEKAAVLREELFGPMLPIIAYDDLDGAIGYINKQRQPLAIYYFDSNRARIRRILRETSSGGVTVNDTLLHFICDALPKGGVGESGFGSYGGVKSFETFSHLKSVFYGSRWIQTHLFKPPYGPRFDAILRWLMG